LENLRQKTFGNLNRDGVTGLEWMPSGDVLYVTRIVGDRDLWLYRAADDSRRQLTKNVADLNENPVAASDGKFIFFNSNRSGAIHVWRMDASGANPTQITFGEKQTEIYPQISPDGAWLYYIQRSSAASIVRRKSLTGERDESLTEPDKLAPSGFLSLSPDGKFLAFQNLIEKVNEEAGKQIYQIAVIPTDKPAAPKILSIAASRLVVRWASDGAALDYIENDSEGAKIWRQNLDGNNPPALVLQLPQAFLHNFAWSADGEKLVLSRGRQLNDAILLTNFQP
jgi:Tol biopolymer transport system component